MRTIKAQYVLVAMLLLAIVAFGTGPLLYRDRSFPNIPSSMLAYTEHGVQMGIIDPPLVWSVQLTDVRVTGLVRYDVAGTAIWRTLFGIPVGVVHAVGTDAIDRNVDWQKMIRVWLTFLLVEAVMGLYVVWWVREYWW